MFSVFDQDNLLNTVVKNKAGTRYAVTNVRSVTEPHDLRLELTPAAVDEQRHLSIYLLVNGRDYYVAETDLVRHVQSQIGALRDKATLKKLLDTQVRTRSPDDATFPTVCINTTVLQDMKNLTEPEILTELQSLVEGDYQAASRAPDRQKQETAAFRQKIQRTSPARTTLLTDIAATQHKDVLQGVSATKEIDATSFALCIEQHWNEVISRINLWSPARVLKVEATVLQSDKVYKRAYITKSLEPRATAYTLYVPVIAKTQGSAELPCIAGITVVCSAPNGVKSPPITALKAALAPEVGATHWALNRLFSEEYGFWISGLPSGTATVPPDADLFPLMPYVVAGLILAGSAVLFGRWFWGRSAVEEDPGTEVQAPSQEDTEQANAQQLLTALQTKMNVATNPLPSSNFVADLADTTAWIEGHAEGEVLKDEVTIARRKLTNTWQSLPSVFEDAHRMAISQDKADSARDIRHDWEGINPNEDGVRLNQKQINQTKQRMENVLLNELQTKMNVATNPHAASNFVTDLADTTAWIEGHAEGEVLKDEVTIARRKLTNTWQGLPSVFEDAHRRAMSKGKTNSAADIRRDWQGINPNEDGVRLNQKQIKQTKQRMENVRRFHEKVAELKEMLPDQLKTNDISTLNQFAEKLQDCLDCLHRDLPGISEEVRRKQVDELRRKGTSLINALLNKIPKTVQGSTDPDKINNFSHFFPWLTARYPAAVDLADEDVVRNAKTAIDNRIDYLDQAQKAFSTEVARVSRMIDNGTSIEAVQGFAVSLAEFSKTDYQCVADGEKQKVLNKLSSRGRDAMEGLLNGLLNGLTDQNPYALATRWDKWKNEYKSALQLADDTRIRKTQSEVDDAVAKWKDIQEKRLEKWEEESEKNDKIAASIEVSRFDDSCRSFAANARRLWDLRLPGKNDDGSEEATWRVIHSNLCDIVRKTLRGEVLRLPPSQQAHKRMRAIKLLLQMEHTTGRLSDCEEQDALREMVNNYFDNAYWSPAFEGSIAAALDVQRGASRIPWLKKLISQRTGE